MKTLIGLIIFVALAFIIGGHCENNRDPYEEGMHWDYNIHCENGFVYKHQRGMTIQVLNSDGTPLKCGSQIH
jgi:hypothetical protein